MRAQYAKNRPQFYRDITLPFYGYNRPGAEISEGIRDKWWLQGMMGGVKAGYDCIKAFSETDFTEDLKKFDIPTLIMHGEDDQIVPIAAAALQSAKIVKGATLIDLSRLSAWHAHHPRRQHQRRPAGVLPQERKRSRVKKKKEH